MHTETSELLKKKHKQKTYAFNSDFECTEYDNFIKEMDKLHSKVKSGDLSDFTEEK